MPTLDWIGKSKVVNHHLDVPYKVLNRTYSYDQTGQNQEDNGSENMIIHGDNLEALKSLLPKYEGRIKCIYIDPPYNTGNEGWVYNDNVNDPRIQKWLGEVVGPEKKDLSRHDKWLCMMYPRLKLLYRLLSDDGAIFISIDEHEYSNLQTICNEIFGHGKHIGTFVWQKRTSPDARKKISTGHEYIIVYAKNPYAETTFNLLRLEGSDAASFKNPDNDPRGPWTSSDFTAQGWRPNQMYEITTPSGLKMTPPEGRCWRHLEDVYHQLLSEGRLWFGTDGTGVPRKKTYLSEKEGKGTWTWWTNVEVGHTQEATQELGTILGKAVFDYPKPVRLIKRIVELASSPSDIILDSFAGSGTTAHAVLEANKRDGGNRKFILIEMMDYADSITAERVKRVITGYKKDYEDILYDQEITAKNLDDGPMFIEEAKNIAKEAKSHYSSVKSPQIVDGHLRVIGIMKAKDQVPGTGGSFSYYELGEPILIDDYLNENIGTDLIREYICYMETKQPPVYSEDEPYLLGTFFDTAYYFAYEKDAETTLDQHLLSTIKTEASSYVIYADSCRLSDRDLLRYHITFKKIPRDISRL